jgi:hypothetical protein
MKLEIPTSGYILYALSCILRSGFEGPRLSMSVGIIGLKAMKEPLLSDTLCGCSPWEVTKHGSHKKVTGKPFHVSLMFLGQTTDDE